MILNKLYGLFPKPRFVIFPALTINFALFRKQLARFPILLTAQDTSKLIENERNTDRCTTQSSENA